MHKYSLVVVEDDAVTRRTLEHFLREMGHDVLAMVSSAEECLELLAELTPELVLMDILLEGAMDGREAALRIASDYDLPVILLTNLSPEETMDGREFIASSYIQKPIHKSELAANIQLAVMNHRMEQRLRESERRYRSLFDNAVAGIYQATPDGRVIDANNSFARILGYDSPAEVVAHLRNIDLQYHDAQGRWPHILQRLQQEHELVSIRSQVLGRDGDLLWVSEHLRAITDANGHIACIVGVVVNITELKNAEDNLSVNVNLLHQTVDSLPDPLVLTDLDANIILYNLPFTKRFSPNGSLEGSRLREVLPAVLHEQCEQALIEFTDSSGAATSISSPNGATVSVSPYRDAQGELVGALFLIRNVEQDS
ncbi:MAG: PAS domain S-box protein [Oceanidesulfovibrio sp.]